MSDIPYGFCHCGCGDRAPLVTHTSAAQGIKKGAPRQYIKGHWARIYRKKMPSRWKLSESERFAQYTKLDPETGCHIWTGTQDHNGYGTFYYKGKPRQASRIAWLMSGRTIPADKPHVLHNCPGGDNPLCVNPEHLWCGTQAENTEDMARKQRGRRSKTGLPYGVKQEPGGRYTARIRRHGKDYYFGTYDAWQEAAALAHLNKNLSLFPDRSVN